MGWWQSDEGLIGDGPVDLVEDIMAEWARGDVRPTWQQFIDGLGGATGNAVCARFATNEELRSDPRASRTRYLDALRDAVEQVTEEYEETQHRKPTVAEVLGTFAFSLRASPDRFIRNEGRGKLATLYTCPRGGGE
jgi:hypothetical protein